MKDFIMAALPWVLMGIAIAVACVSFAAGKQKKNEKTNAEAVDTDKQYGMPIGMCLGLSIGVAIGASTDNLGLWMSLGLCLGVALGAAFSGKDGGAEK